jgi:hypothetical protein
MPDPGTDLRDLAARLRAAGTEGKGLRRALVKAITDAAKPIADEIASLPNLDEHLPDRYAAVLAGDLKVTVTSSLSGDPKVTVTARAQARKRKVGRLEDGFISHPVYAQGPRRSWNWKNGNLQTGGMKPGFFTGPAKAAAPAVRDKVMAALSDTARQIAG